MGRIRVLLADDHEEVLARVRVILGEEFDIVNAVNNGRDAIEETERLDPDVLVIDISMPILNGLQAASKLRETNLRTKIVFLTVHEDPDFVAAALAAGASAYVTKEDVTTVVHMSVIATPGIYEVLQGGTYISQSILL